MTHEREPGQEFAEAGLSNSAQNLDSRTREHISLLM